MRTNQYTATLSEAIRTSQTVDDVTFAVCTDLATYKPEGKGKIIVNAVGSEAFDAKKMSWTVTGDDGLEIASKGSDLFFTVKKGVTKPELLVHVKITYDGPKGKVDLDLPGVVIISKD